MKTVVVLGCGPSGLLVVHAARQAGYRVIVISVKRPSQLFGCQYLHAEIPELPSKSSEVLYRLIGAPLEYAAKVYGPDHQPLQVSPETLVGTHPAWDIRKAYARLWLMYGERVIDAKVTASDVPEIMSYYDPDFLVNTIPAPWVCSDSEHRFDSISCWAVGDAPELGQYAPELAPPFTVICDGTKDHGFYRASNVFGYKTVEWPGWRNRPPIHAAVQFTKPLKTNCDCHPEMHRMGRMGKWQKGVLAHHAYEEAVRLFSS